MAKITNLFLEVFKDSWDNFKKYRPTYSSKYYDEVIEKVMICSDPSNGYIQYQCTHCGEDEKIVAFTCKHVFCLRCGTMKAMDFVEEVKAKMYEDNV